MVDARTTAAPRGATGTLGARVLGLGAEAISAYRRFAADAVHAPPQDALWVSAWARTRGIDGAVVLIEADGAPVLALALEFVSRHGVRTARFMGGSHANGNFAAMSRSGLPALEMRTVADLLKRALPRVDIVHLERQERSEGGVGNPFLALRHSESPNLALASDLSAGFDPLLERLSGKRKRKKWRSQQRKFEAAGSFRVFEAGTPEEVRRQLEAFFAMKADRFAGKGIEDVFAPAPVRAFFEALFTEALSAPGKPFRLAALEVAGVLRAVNGCSVSGQRVVCEFGAIADDELAGASPGDFLFFETIRDTAERGATSFDFSVGDEPYKRQWCDTEIRHFDTVIPLTAKGRLAALALTATARAKRAIKANPTLWNAVKRLRAGRAREVEPAPADS